MGKNDSTRVPRSLPFRRALLLVGGSPRLWYYQGLQGWDLTRVDEEGLPQRLEFFAAVDRSASTFSGHFGSGLASERDPLLPFWRWQGRKALDPLPDGMERVVIEAREWSCEPYLAGWRDQAAQMRLSQRDAASSLLTALSHWSYRNPSMALLGLERSRERLPTVARRALWSLHPTWLRASEHEGPAIRELVEVARVMVAATAHDSVSGPALQRARARLPEFSFRDERGRAPAQEAGTAADIGRFMSIYLDSREAPDGDRPASLRAALAAMQKAEAQAGATRP